MDNNRLNLNQLSIGMPLVPWKIDSIFDDHVPNIDDYLGKPLLILIFGLGCPGCLGRAIPYANRVVFENGENVKVVGIHTNFEGLDFMKDDFGEAKELYHIRFPFFEDQNYDTTFLNYGAGGTPHWILVDKGGKLVYSIFGSDPNNALLRLDLKIQELLQG